MSNFGPWTRNEVLDLHIFILLIIWMTLDRAGIYFADILRWCREMFAFFTRFADDDFWE